MTRTYIQPILIVSGVATAAAIAVFFAPAAVLDMYFEHVPTDPVSLFFFRHWGLMIFCIGALIVRGRLPSRAPDSGPDLCLPGEDRSGDRRFRLALAGETRGVGHRTLRRNLHRALSVVFGRALGRSHMRAKSSGFDADFDPSRRTLLAAFAGFALCVWCMAPVKAEAADPALMERRTDQAVDHRFRHPRHQARRTRLRGAARADRHHR